MSTPALVLLLGGCGGVVEIDVDCPAVLVLGEMAPLPMAWPTVQFLQPPFRRLCSQMPEPLKRLLHSCFQYLLTVDALYILHSCCSICCC